MSPSDGTEILTPPDPSAGEFILVPGNPTYGTTDFYVAKYEAKNSSGRAVSQSAGKQPGLATDTAFSYKSFSNPGLQWNQLPYTSRPLDIQHEKIEELETRGVTRYIQARVLFFAEDRLSRGLAQVYLDLTLAITPMTARVITQDSE